MKILASKHVLILSAVLVALALLGVLLISHSSTGKAKPVTVEAASHVAPSSTLGASMSSTAGVAVSAGSGVQSTSNPATHMSAQQAPATSTQQTAQNTVVSNVPSAAANNQSSDDIAVSLHIGGYPPAVGAALTDYVNPTHVPCSNSQYPQNPNCSFNSYQWVETRYCVFTYADKHTQKQIYQYLAYGDIYANSDGTLSPSGVNMTVTSQPTYACDIASAPKSVFEPNYVW